MALKQCLIGVSMILNSLSIVADEDQKTREIEPQGHMLENVAPPSTMAERLELRRQLSASRVKTVPGLEAQKNTANKQATNGEVPPETVNKVKGDLVKRINAEQDSIDVLHAESLIWNDGSLGCGKPGQMYTQALIPGYRIILGHAGQQFDYRTSRQGLFILCDQPHLPVPGTGAQPPVQ